ncbi:site-specific integrase [Porticoccaceae bacterium]|nr:site-specific integrase [Porticoccaceae bacterium]
MKEDFKALKEACIIITEKDDYMFLSPKSLKRLVIMSKQGKASTLDPIQHQEMLQFLSNSRHSRRNKAIYLLTYRAGLRIGSVAGLRLNDVIDSSGKLKEVINLHSSIVKGGKNYAAYINHPELRQALVEYLSIRPTRKGVDALFVSQKGSAFTSNSLSHLMLKLYHSAGFEQASSHSGRRSFATNILRSGVDIVALKTLMNHSNIATTAEYVSHNEDYLKKAILGA